MSRTVPLGDLLARGAGRSGPEGSFGGIPVGGRGLGLMAVSLRARCWLLCASFYLAVILRCFLVPDVISYMVAFSALRWW